MIRARLVPLAMISLAAAALSACSVGGHATPDPSTGTSARSTAPSSGAANPFAGLNPCKVLDQALAGQGYTSGTPTTADSKRGCAAAPLADKAVSVSVLLQDGQTMEQGVDDPSKAQTGTVNDRAAIQEREALGDRGDCDVRMEVKPNSRALVLVNTSTKTTDEACQLANDVATKVEPLLPKNN